MDDPPSEPSPTLVCPLCGEPVDPPDYARPPFVCPGCRGQYIAAARVGEEVPAEELPSAPGGGGARQVELDGTRIRNLAALRRGAYRSRSYWLIVAAVLGVAALRLGQMAYVSAGNFGLGVRPAGYVLAGAVAAGGVVVALLRAARFAKEAGRSDLVPADTTPDFSTLGDGRRQRQDLENLVA